MQLSKKNLQAVGYRGFPRHRRVSWGILPTPDYRVMKVWIARMGSYPRGFTGGIGL